MNQARTNQKDASIFQQAVDPYFIQPTAKPASPLSLSTKNENYTSFRQLCDNPQKLRYTYQQSDVLAYTALRLHILADLFEVHFVPATLPELQQQAITIARDLAEQLETSNNPSAISHLLNVDFDRLCRIILELKQATLITDAGMSWFNLMRNIALETVEAIKRYSYLERHKNNSKQAEVSKKTHEVNLS